jgi:hypothetical protein
MLQIRVDVGVEVEVNAGLEEGPPKQQKKTKKGRFFFVKGFTVVFHLKLKTLKMLKINNKK